MYKLSKKNGLHCAVTKVSEIIQFSSLNKKRVTDWLDANNPTSDNTAPEALRIPEQERRKNKR